MKFASLSQFIFPFSGGSEPDRNRRSFRAPNSAPIAGECVSPVTHPEHLLRPSDFGLPSDFGSRTSTLPLLRFHCLSKFYGPIKALAGVDLCVPRGSTLALLGPNGAGKSTLFGCLLGLVRPTSGAISFNNGPLDNDDRSRFGYVAERVALYPNRTVRENGLFFTRLKGHSADEFERQLLRVGLSKVQHRPVRHLSKGMLQRLGLAIALSGRPELLVLDEPFNGLDPALLDDLRDILLEESRRGATLLIATHTISAVESLASHVVILLNGSVAAAGALEELQITFPDSSLESIYHQVARRNHEPGQEDSSV